MHIILSSRPEADKFLQWYGNDYAQKVVSEDSAIESLGMLTKKNRRMQCLGAIGAVLFACNIALTLFFDDQASQYSLEYLCMLLVSFGCIMWGLGKSMDLRYMIWVHDKLGSGNPLCLKLLQLSSLSTGVAEYIKAVTLSGRQLRILDVARANVIYSDELAKTEREDIAGACVALHSL